MYKVAANLVQGGPSSSNTERGTETPHRLFSAVRTSAKSGYRPDFSEPAKPPNNRRLDVTFRKVTIPELTLALLVPASRNYSVRHISD